MSFLLALFAASSFAAGPPSTATFTRTETFTPAPASDTYTQTPTLTATPLPTNTATPTPVATAVPGCLSVGSVGLLYAQTSQLASDTVAGTANPTTFGSQFTLCPDQMVAGQVYRLTDGGMLGTALLGASLRVQVFVNGNVSLMDTGSVLLASALSSAAWNLDSSIIVRSAGASGRLLPDGLLTFGSDGADLLSRTVTIGGGEVLFDTRQNATFTVVVTWGASSASNTITQAGLTFFYAGMQ